MDNLVKYLEVLQEIEEEKKELRKLGLTEEDIAGYLDFFFFNFWPINNLGDKN